MSDNNQLDKEWLRRKKDELYLHMVELNNDADRLKKLSKAHYLREYKNKLISLSYAIEDEVDRIDETCIQIEVYLINSGTKK